MNEYLPSLEQVKGMAGQGNVVPVYREVVADLETPVSAYLKVTRGKYSFLLESVEGGERLARYSFIGTEPYRVLRTGTNAMANEIGGDPLVEIEDELRRFTPVRVEGLPRFHGGAVGYMAYEVARYYETLPMPEADPQGFPESIFLFIDTLLVFDHLQHKIKVVSHARLDGDIEASYRQATWKIEELVSRLAKPLSSLPYSGAGERHERSEARSNNTREEFMCKVERAKEHIMLVDLARNDVGRVCEPGTVKVTSLMAIERYSHVMHMVSHVVGRLHVDVSMYDALRAYFPHGTVTGAPKIRTMEILAELEGE